MEQLEHEMKVYGTTYGVEVEVAATFDVTTETYWGDRGRSETDVSEVNFRSGTYDNDDGDTYYIADRAAAIALFGLDVVSRWEGDCAEHVGERL